MIRRVSGSHESDSGYRVLTGDVREMLATLPDESAQCCVTSPPYWGLRDYKTEPQVWGGDAGCEHEWQVEIRKAQLGGTASKKVQIKGKDNFQIVPESEYAFCQKCSAWRGHLGLEPTPELYVEHIVDVFREVRRVLRKDGTFWLNIGDCYAGSWGAQSRSGDETGVSGEQIRAHPKGQTRTGSLTHTPGLKPKDLVGIPWRVAFALQADEWYLRSDVIWAKPNPMPESCRDRPTKAHEYVFLLTKSQRYYWDQEAVREVAGTFSGFRGSQGSKSGADGDRNDGGRSSIPNQTIGRNIRSVWTIPTQPFPEAHFATFPEALPERCIQAGTSERGCCPECRAPWERIFSRIQKRPIGWCPTCGCGGEGKTAEISHPPVPCTVLDPFVGSGTTAIVAVRLGRRAVGIDLNETYTAMVSKQLAVVEPGSARRPRKFRLKGRGRIPRSGRRQGAAS